MKNLLTILVLSLCSLTVIAQSPTNTDIYGRRAATPANAPSVHSPSAPSAGNEWVPVGPFGGDVTDLAVSPTVPLSVFAAAGNPFASSDGGTTWSAIEPLSTLASGSVGAIEAAANGTLIATGTYVNSKVFRSTDNGVTWQNRTIPVSTPGMCIAADPNDSNIIYVGVASLTPSSTNKVIVKSVNNGLNWTALDLISVLPVGYSVQSLCVDPSNSQTLFAIGREGFSNALLVASFDGGATWEDRTGSLPSGIPYNCVAIGGGNVYVAGGQLFGSQFMGVYKSTDYGLTWNDVSGSFPNKAANYILVNPADPDLLFACTEGDGIYSSANGGTTWSYTTNGAGDNGAARTMICSPGSTDTVYAGYLSIAVCRTANGGSSWDYSNSGIATLLVNDVETGVPDPTVVLAGFEAQNSGGCYLSHDEGATWSLVTGLPGTRFSKTGCFADGALCAWSNGPTTVAQEGLYKSTDNGVTWTNMGPNVGDLFETEIHALATSATDPGLVFIGGNNFGVNGWKPVIHRSTNGGQTWDNVYIGTEDFDSFQYIFIDPSSGDQVIYAALGSQVVGALLKSTDGGDTWMTISDGIPGAEKWFGSVVCDPENTQKVITGAGGFGTPGTAWISPDGGSTWDFTYLILDSYSKVTDLCLNPATSVAVYASTVQDGVYLSADGGFHWLAANTNLPATNITAFSRPFPSAMGYDIFASTYTNSIFRTRLFNPYEGISGAGQPSDLSVYPNPNDGNFSIKSGPGATTLTRIEIFNSIGVRVGSYDLRSDKNEYDLHLNLPAGIYVGKVYDGETSLGIVKIVVR
jgi:photosystem II stability/assembly factor-like uncharacterized protein